MSAVDEILSRLPLDQLAAQLGATPAEVHDAAYAVVPALLGGLHANVQEPDGEASLLRALDQHQGDVDVSSVDVSDGERAAAHIFGDHKDQVVSQLGSTGAGSSLVQKLLPMLAPIVLSYVAKQVSGGSGSPSRAGAGGVLGTILSQVLSGAAQGTRSSGASAEMPGVGSILGDLLGGLLGGGRR